MASLEERLTNLRETGNAAPPSVGPDKPIGQGFITGMSNELLGGYQGTSPVTHTLKGKPNYKKVGVLSDSDYGPVAIGDDGTWTDFDPMEHVVLIDEQTNKPTVYLRSDETDEALGGFARLLLFGNLVNPVASRASAGAQRAPGMMEQMRRAGVDPTLPTVTNSRTVGTAANTLRELPVAGGVMERGAQRSLQQTANAAEQTAAGFGSAATKQGGGDAALRGARRVFPGRVSSDVSLADDAVEEIIRTPTRKVFSEAGEGFLLKAKALYQRVDEFFKPTDHIDVGNSMDVLTGSRTRFDLSKLGDEFVSPRFQKWAKIIQDNGGALSFNDLRLFRTEVGRLLRKPATVLGSDLDTEALKRLYGALSDDLVTFAKASKGDDAVRAIQQADDYYRAGAERMRGALDKLLKPDANGEATFDLLVRKAGEKGGANLKELQAIRKSIPDDEWGELASSVIREMGKAPAGQVDRLDDVPDFSISAFLTNFERLSDGGKDALFGTSDLRGNLETLADVVAAQRRVERLANTSGTGRVVMTGALGTLALFDVLTGAAIAGGSTVAARLMMSPRFVKWLHAAPTTSFKSRAWAQHAAELHSMFASSGNEMKAAADWLLSALDQEGVETRAKPQNLEGRLQRLRESIED